MTKKTNKVEELRREIDVIDDEIIALLVKRYGLASEIGRAKREDGTPVKDANREERVLSRIRGRTRKPLSRLAAEKIYKVILKESRDMQAGKRTKRA